MIFNCILKHVYSIGKHCIKDFGELLVLFRAKYEPPFQQKYEHYTGENTGEIQVFVLLSLFCRYTGKITKLRALYGRFSTNACIYEHARTNTGDLSHTAFCVFLHFMQALRDTGMPSDPICCER